MYTQDRQTHREGMREREIDRGEQRLEVVVVVVLIVVSVSIGG